MKLPANDALVYCHLTSESTVDEIVAKLKPQLDEVEFRSEFCSHWDLEYKSDPPSEELICGVLDELLPDGHRGFVDLNKVTTLRKGEATLYLRGVE
jgi:hypothetical protein